MRYEATWQPSDTQHLRLDYEYADRREQYSGTKTEYDTTRNYVTLNHVYQFGLDNRSRLETLARYQQENGDLARDIAEIIPQLRLQHTDSLATTYRAQYLQESFQGIERHMVRGDVGLIHQLGQALTSTSVSSRARQVSRNLRMSGPDFAPW